MTSLGKFGAFPSSQLIGLHYDITYEVVPDLSNGSASPGLAGDAAEAQEKGQADVQFGQKRKKNKKGKGAAGGSTEVDVDGSKGKLGWNNILRPLRRQPLVDAVIGG